MFKENAPNPDALKHCSLFTAGGYVSLQHIYKRFQKEWEPKTPLCVYSASDLWEVNQAVVSCVCMRYKV